jgi:predicted CoA-binding protein
MISKETVDSFLSEKELVLAGASRSGKKFGNYIVKELSQKGYNFSLLHPEVNEIDGVKCFSDINSLPNNLNAAVICLPADKTLNLLKELKNSPIKKYWIQQGADSKEVREYVSNNNLDAVYGECIMMHAQPVQSFHGFHRWLWKIFGKLPK